MIHAVQILVTILIGARVLKTPIVSIYFYRVGCYGQGILCNGVQKEWHTGWSASCNLHDKIIRGRQALVRLRHAGRIQCVPCSQTARRIYPPWERTGWRSGAPDMITWDDDPENKRAKMPCGHAISKEAPLWKLLVSDHSCFSISF